MRMRSRRKQIPNSSDRATFEFAQNSLVEVQSNQESFKNVYFTATVISFTNKHQSKILVEYQNLFDHRNCRLRDYVPVSCVRPIPPPQQEDVVVTNCRFLPEDVVDVFYRNCWWKAVVARVIHGGRKCVVTFHDLDGEEHEFEVAHVRLHWDWVHGTWLRLPSLTQESILPETQASISKRKRGKPPKKRKRELMNCVDGRLRTYEIDPHKFAEQGPTGAAFGGLLNSSSARYNSECSRALEFIDLVVGSIKDSKRSCTLEFIGEAVESMKEMSPNDFLTDVQSRPFSNIIDMLWKPIERMFSFKWKPHFHGLLHKDRLLRIAGAVGSMVLLVAIVETVSDTETLSKLDLSMLKTIMDTLTMLEVEGFNVSVVRDCVARLVASRDKQGNLDNVASELDGRISLHKDKRSRIEIEIREYNDEKCRIEKEMMELDEKVSFAQVAKDTEDSEITSLQADLLEAKEAIQNAKHEFQDIAASCVFSCL